ncbi:alpha/beta fold hydrolase [Nocardioides sp. MAH-18]|uniref:Alpha/beta fold hydrolase n=1 Tax=Nocardioides agri TaxID=2682843 RepID=A0A6L6XW17_9ACTN|nr:MULTISPECIES: alpha/beta fold hydrolase [unclassified Nocardioides]MBA2955827.1 alpha/beta fold hydrolase [Nocardioides sp. CGMCC 1.13656]MVQ50676.1 alpha/beta fold hydrolase [Nocardioides sp. MAH-18]
MSDRIRVLHHDGLSFDVLDEGPEDGTPVVLLHGFPERSSTWRDVVPRLHAAGLRTYALDQRGYSPGARPRGRRSYRMHHLAGDVAALIEQIGQPVHLVGHDWGAAVGWAVAGRFGDRVLTYTALSVPHPAAFARAMKNPSQRRRSRYMAVFNIPVLPELAARKPGGQFDQAMRKGGMTADEVARFRREIVEYGALRHALGWYRALPVTRPGSTDFHVRVPTTLVWSDRDIAIGREGVDGTARWVDGPYELVVLEGVSHWIPTQAADACADAILARVRG